MKKYYQIDGENGIFETLREAKHHVNIAYTPRERWRFLRDCAILGVNKKNNEVITITPIIIDDDGNFRFGKTY